MDEDHPMNCRKELKGEVPRKKNEKDVDEFDGYWSIRPSNPITGDAIQTWVAQLFEVLEQGSFLKIKV